MQQTVFATWHDLGLRLQEIIKRRTTATNKGNTWNFSINSSRNHHDELKKIAEEQTGLQERIGDLPKNENELFNQIAEIVLATTAQLLKAKTSFPIACISKGAFSYNSKAGALGIFLGVSVIFLRERVIVNGSPLELHFEDSTQISRTGLGVLAALDLYYDPTPAIHGSAEMRRRYGLPAAISHSLTEKTYAISDHSIDAALRHI